MATPIKSIRESDYVFDVLVGYVCGGFFFPLDAHQWTGLRTSTCPLIANSDGMTLDYKVPKHLIFVVL